MLLTLRDKNNKLVVKDMLDIDFDMSVEKEKDKFYVSVNHNLKLSDEFTSETEAEEIMLSIADARNNLENELKNY